MNLQDKVKGCVNELTFLLDSGASLRMAYLYATDKWDLDVFEAKKVWSHVGGRLPGSEPAKGDYDASQERIS